MPLPPGVDSIVFEDLKRAYDAGKLVVFAGAGVSAGAGLPAWGELTRLLVVRMKQVGAARDAVAETEEMIQRGDLVGAMGAARAALRLEFDREIKRHLDDDGRAVPAAAQAIAALSPRLAGVVTTNLDRFLERALGGAWPPIVKPLSDLLHRSRYIFKPHGTLDDPDTWVFTRPEYDRAMFGSQPLQDLFNALYHGRTLLFVGASLTDDDFGLTLGRVRALAGRNPPTHYAILPGPMGPARRDQLDRSGIRLLLYENQSGVHREVIDLLHELAGHTRAAAGAQPASPPVSPQSPAARSPQGTAPASPPPAASPGIAPKPGGVDIYLSAAPQDTAWRDKLLRHMKPLELSGRVRLLHTVPVGQNIQDTVRGYIEAARIILVLLSPDHLASDEHLGQTELALEQSKRRRAVVVPVILRACAWDLMPIGKLKPLPADGRPIASRNDPDAALLEVAMGVRRVLDASSSSP